MKSGNTPEKRRKRIEVLFIHILLLTAVRDQKQSSFLKLSLKIAPRTVTITLKILTADVVAEVHCPFHHQFFHGLF